MSTAQITQQAKIASYKTAAASTQQKNDALQAIAEQIKLNRKKILTANDKDLAHANHNKLDAALIDRLALDDNKIDAMIDGLMQIISLPDPIGHITEKQQQSSGITTSKMRVPLGVVCIIYESRPNVTIDAAALCLKSGNAAILRGGSEAIQSNIAIAECITTGLKQSNMDPFCIQLISNTDRKIVSELLKAKDKIDIIIPRGGKGLIEKVSKESSIPVIKHLDGICHVYIDDHADKETAINITLNAKTQRYGTCNTLETLIVSKNIAPNVLPEIAKQLREKNVEIRGCKKTQQYIKECTPATEEDWQTEYLAPILSIKIVNDVTEAIEHINHYGSGHTDSIITESKQNTEQFLRQVDSSSVMLNTSTRFADGFEYGLGAEIGISTDKLHARGPVGLDGLTSQKYIVTSNGKVRQ